MSVSVTDSLGSSNDHRSTMDPGQPSESTSSSTPALSYRLVTFDDEDELRRMRRVCGTFSQPIMDVQSTISPS